MDNTKEIVAQRLKELLECSALSQSEFANKCSLTKDAVSKIINGKMALSVPSALKIAHAFGVSLDYLFGLSEFSDDAHRVYDFQKRHLHLYPWYLASSSEISPRFPAISASMPFSRCWDSLYKAKTTDLPDDIKEDWFTRIKKEMIIALQANEAPDGEEFILVPTKNIDTENLAQLESLFKK